VLAWKTVQNLSPGDWMLGIFIATWQIQPLCWVPLLRFWGVSWCSLGNTWNLKGKQISIDENGGVQPSFIIWFIIQLKANHFNQSGSFRFLVVLKVDKYLPQDLRKYVAVSNIFHFNPYLERRSYLTNSFQLG